VIHLKGIKTLKKEEGVVKHQVKAISNNMLESLDRRGERELDKEQPSSIQGSHDTDHVRYINACLEAVDPEAKKAWAEARRMHGE
jgi:hypothetical protein